VLAAGILLVAGGSPAAAASGDRLSISAARKLAIKLVEKQKQERSLVFTQLGDAVRRSAKRVDFPYRDRSSSDVLCTATIAVIQRGTVQTGRKRSAEMRDAHCHGIPGEILAYEDITRSLRGWVKDHRQAVRDSLQRYDDALARCDSVTVPSDRRKQVNLFFDAAEFRAFFAPMRARLDEFAIAQRDLDPQDPVMRRGTRAWERTLVLVDALPASTEKPCKSIRDWAANGWTDATAPADFDKLKVVRDQLLVQADLLDKSAVHLDDQGVVRRVAAVFAPTGILALVDASRGL